MEQAHDDSLELPIGCPNYTHNRFIEQSIERIEFSQEVLRFLTFNMPSIEPLLKSSTIDRIVGALNAENITCEYSEVAELLRTKNERTELGKHVQAYVKSYKYLLKQDEVEEKQLKKGHEILLRRTELQDFGGLINVPAKESAETRGQITAFDYLLKSLNGFDEIHPVITAWWAYYLTDVAEPFGKFNSAMSFIILNWILDKNNLSFDGYLNLSKYVNEDWQQHQKLMDNSLFPLQTEERIKIDFTPFLEHVLKLTVDCVESLMAEVLVAFKKYVRYDKLAPLQRNSIHYLFDRGFNRLFKHRHELSTRQKGILLQLAIQRKVSTKEMVMMFRCDRKTIQRDFSQLIDLNLVQQTGRTKTINYITQYQ